MLVSLNSRDLTGPSSVDLSNIDARELGLQRHRGTLPGWPGGPFVNTSTSQLPGAAPATPATPATPAPRPDPRGAAENLPRYPYKGDPPEWMNAPHPRLIFALAFLPAPAEDTSAFNYEA